MTQTKQVILLLACMMLISPVWAKTVIDEGLIIKGIEGVVRKVEKVDVWNFIPDADITMPKGTLPAGKAISLLPCSVLEQISSLAGADNQVHVRLWAMFTEYGWNNYLFSVYFLPISEDADAQPEKPDASDGKKEDKAKAATDKEDSIIPGDILTQIKSNKAPDLQKFQQIAKVSGDMNLIGKAGHLKKQGKIKYFQPDAFGYKIDNSQYLLLPCKMLKHAERQMNKSPGRQRYNVSGLVTVYKNRRYILLRRTVRTYTNGNFTP